MNTFNKLTAAVVLATAASAVAYDCSADAGDWTIHTVSAHVGVSGLNNFNPGVGYDLTDNLRIGALYNSYKKPSAYALGFLELHPRVRAGAGLISGYTFEPGTFRAVGKTAGLIPAVAVEVDLTKNLSVVWFGQAFNLEVKF